MIASLSGMALRGRWGWHTPYTIWVRARRFLKERGPWRLWFHSRRQKANFLGAWTPPNSASRMAPIRVLTRPQFGVRPIYTVLASEQSFSRMLDDSSDKLDALRRLDQFRQWYSLDDRRRCLQCGRIMTGHEIELVGGRRGCGPLHARCPTENCESIPLDWALVSDGHLFAVRDGTQEPSGLSL